MRQTMRSACVVAFVLLARHSVLYAQSPVGTAFTYQGQLKDVGLPAGGDYDFVFRLFDAATGGVQIGSDFPVDDWPVSDGLFTVQVDFGDSAFNSNARWLEVAVRPWDSNDPHTVLSPRQPVTAAPVALYALDGPGSGGYWTLIGDHIRNNNAGYVGIGTDTPIALLEVLTPEREHGVRATCEGIPITAIRTSTTGTWPAIHAQCDSESANASAIRGYIMSTSPGSSSVAVKGVNHGTGGAGIGVIGTQDGSGYGVYGYSPSGLGVYGDSDDGTAVRGHSDTYYGGFFSGPDNDGSVAPVRITAGSQTMLIGGNEIDSASSLYLNNNTTAGVDIANGGGDVTLATGGGNVGIGTTGPTARLHVSTSTDQAAQFTQWGTSPGVSISLINSGSNYSALNVYSTSNNAPALSVTGTASVDVLEIYGADVAEKFPVSEEVKPGMVVAIDAENPGKLCLARGAYTRRVAGVVSGAGDIPSGTILGNLPGCEDAPAIALNGRVWVHCDATTSAIEPGDLLTTSDTPGYAMAVSDFSRAHGAVIGKAMTPLAHGETGMVLVLVNLQ